MEIWEEISRQRVQYIIDSYQLDQADDESSNEYFAEYLEDLLQAYAPPQIELALVQVLVENWRAIPLTRGIPFLERSHHLLKQWETGKSLSIISPTQFRLITGLDPTPVFGYTAVNVKQYVPLRHTI